jgi:hypothetical protein
MKDIGFVKSVKGTDIAEGGHFLAHTLHDHWLGCDCAGDEIVWREQVCIEAKQLLWFCKKATLFGCEDGGVRKAGRRDGRPGIA